MKKKILLCIGIICILICFIFGCGKYENGKNYSNVEIKNSDCIKDEKEKVPDEEKYTNNSNSENSAKGPISNVNSSSNDKTTGDNKPDNKLKAEKKSDSTKNADTKQTSKENGQKSTENSKKSQNEIKTDKETFTIIISKEQKGYTGKQGEILKKKEIKLNESKKSAMTYLRENFSMKENGGFIYEIDEIHNLYPIPQSEKTEEQKKNGVLGVDWFIYLNDVKTPVGANDIYPKKGDILNFDIHEWDKREFKQ